MNKKILAFLISIPALFLLFIFKVIPAITACILSLKTYNIFQGVSGSKWIGLGNFTELFAYPEFPSIVRTTLVSNLSSILLTCLLAWFLIMCIVKMPNVVLKASAILVLAIPAFIPVTSFAGILAKVFSADSGFIRGPVIDPVLFIIADTLRNVYIPVIIGVLVCKGTSFNIRKTGMVLAGYIAARATLLLSPDFESIMVLNGKSHVMDTFAFSAGLQNFQYSLAGAVWVVKTIPQLVINIVIYFILRKVTPGISGSVDKLSAEFRNGVQLVLSIVGYLLLAAGSIAVILLAFAPLSGGFSGGIKALLSDSAFIKSVSNTFIYCIFGTAIYGFMTLTLAYPLAVKLKFYPPLLVILMSISNNFIGEYLQIRNLGMIDTVFPVILGSGLSVAGAFALYFSVASKLKGDSLSLIEYLKASILPLFTIMSLAFIAIWGSYLMQLIYLNRISLYGVGIYGQMLLFGQGNASGLSIEGTDIKSAFIFLSSIIPTAFGALLICLNKFLPLLAFMSQIRKG